MAAQQTPTVNSKHCAPGATAAGRALCRLFTAIQLTIVATLRLHLPPTPTPVPTVPHFQTPSPSFNRLPMISTRSSTRASLSLVVASSHAMRRVANRALASSATDQNCREKIIADTLLCGRGVGASARKNASAVPSASTGPSYDITFFDSASVGRHASRRWRSSVVKISADSQEGDRGGGGGRG